MSAAQLVLPGLERYQAAPQWNPRPHTLAIVQEYFRGYEASGRAIYPKRKTVAAKLGIGVRTLSRYLHHLDVVGWLKTVCQRAYTAIRQVFLNVSDKPFAGPPAGTPIKVTSQSTEELYKREVLSHASGTVGCDSRQHAPRPVACDKPGKNNKQPSESGVGSAGPRDSNSGKLAGKDGCSAESRNDREIPTTPRLGLATTLPRKTPHSAQERQQTPSCWEPQTRNTVRKSSRKETMDDFDRYYSTFVDAGVALNEGDKMRACRAWVSLAPDDQAAAISDALILCGGRRAPYIPLPVNHLRSSNWTRVEKPRKLRVELPSGTLRRMMGIA